MAGAQASALKPIAEPYFRNLQPPDLPQIIDLDYIEAVKGYLRTVRRTDPTRTQDIGTKKTADNNIVLHLWAAQNLASKTAMSAEPATMENVSASLEAITLGLSDLKNSVDRLSARVESVCSMVIKSSDHLAKAINSEQLSKRTQQIIMPLTPQGEVYAGPPELTTANDLARLTEADALALTTLYEIKVPARTTASRVRVLLREHFAS